VHNRSSLRLWRHIGSDQPLGLNAERRVCAEGDLELAFASGDARTSLLRGHIIEITASWSCGDITKGRLRDKAGRWLRAEAGRPPQIGGSDSPSAVHLLWCRQREICIESAGSNPPASDVEVHSAPWPVLHFPEGGPNYQIKRREDGPSDISLKK
jgi:hypothetical protein